MDIKSRIKERGFTISEVASKMTTKDRDGSVKTGISQSSLSQLITGNPTFEKLKEIADIIGISVSELVSDDGDTSPNFIAFVRSNGETRTFTSKEELLDFAKELCGEKPITHDNIRGKEYFQNL